MYHRQFVRICPANSVEGVDLELPADESIRSILPDLLKVLDQPTMLGGKRLHYALKNEEDELLDEGKTLTEAGIENFQTLWLTTLVDKTGSEEASDSEKTKVIQTNLPSTSQALPSTSELPRGLRGIMSPLLWSQLPIEKPSLVSPDGLIFELGETPTVIGRYSKDCSPTIDLSELDSEAVSSRRHVEINGFDEKYVLTALKTTNGTFINGVKLNPEEKIILRDGDAIVFGLGGVKLIFCLPKK